MYLCDGWLELLLDCPKVQILDKDMLSLFTTTTAYLDTYLNVGGWHGVLNETIQ